MNKFFGDLVRNRYGNGIKREIEYQQIYKYLTKYQNKEIFYEERKNTGVKINKTIWTCWLQGIDEAPILVQKCFESLRNNKPQDYDLIIITKSNLFEYICLPQYIWDKYNCGIITNTHLSDIIRILLLYEYGGCWIDATVYCNTQIPEFMVSGNIFMFKWSLLDESVLQISSWWIYALKKEKIITDVKNMLLAYWKEEKCLRHYFLLHIIFSKVINIDSFNRSTFRGITYACNSVPHILSRKMEFEFDQKEWDIIKSMTAVHKLSYKRNYLQGDIYSFYIALLDNKLQ